MVKVVVEIDASLHVVGNRSDLVVDMIVHSVDIVVAVAAAVVWGSLFYHLVRGCHCNRIGEVLPAPGGCRLKESRLSK